MNGIDIRLGYTNFRDVSEGTWTACYEYDGYIDFEVFGRNTNIRRS